MWVFALIKYLLSTNWILRFNCYLHERLPGSFDRREKLMAIKIRKDETFPEIQFKSFELLILLSEKRCRSETFVNNAIVR